MYRAMFEDKIMQLINEDCALRDFENGHVLHEHDEYEKKISVMSDYRKRESRRYTKQFSYCYCEM